MSGKRHRRDSHRSSRRGRRQSSTSSALWSDGLTTSSARGSISVEQTSSTSITSQSPPSLDYFQTDPLSPFYQIPRVPQPAPDPVNFAPTQATYIPPYHEKENPEAVAEGRKSLGDQDSGDSMIDSPRTPECPSPSKGAYGKSTEATGSKNTERKGTDKEKKKRNNKEKRRHRQRSSVAPPGMETDARNMHLPHEVMPEGYQRPPPSPPTFDYLRLAGLSGGPQQQQQPPASYYPSFIEEADLYNEEDDLEDDEWVMCEKQS